MPPLYLVLLLAVLPFGAVAQEGVSQFGAATLAPADLLYEKRALVVFADTPRDPAFVRQMDLLARDAAELSLRDVVVLTDTDPAAASAWRVKLRPRGFSLVLVDKDGSVMIRKPLPWEVREITHAIDRTPLGREEMRAKPVAGG